MIDDRCRSIAGGSYRRQSAGAEPTTHRAYALRTRRLPGGDSGGSVGSMSTSAKAYKYLVCKPKSVYKQLFIKERWISARTLYGMFAREESPMATEEIAADYDLPLDAVLEAIAYCESNPPELAEDHAREEAVMNATGMNDPDYDGRPRVLSPQEMSRLRRLSGSIWMTIAHPISMKKASFERSGS